MKKGIIKTNRLIKILTAMYMISMGVLSIGGYSYICANLTAGKIIELLSTLLIVSAAFFIIEFAFLLLVVGKKPNIKSTVSIAVFVVLVVAIAVGVAGYNDYLKISHPERIWIFELQAGAYPVVLVLYIVIRKIIEARDEFALQRQKENEE